MQTEEQLLKAAKAALKQAVEITSELRVAYASMLTASVPPRSKMAKIRKLLAELNQRTHEFNAYHNAATT